MANESMIGRHDKDLYRGNGPGRAGGIISRLSLLEGFQDNMETTLDKLINEVRLWSKKQDRQQWLIIATLIGVIVDIVLRSK